jgi:hypothetical protein
MVIIVNSEIFVRSSVGFLTVADCWRKLQTPLANCRPIDFPPLMSLFVCLFMPNQRRASSSSSSD